MTEEKELTLAKCPTGIQGFDAITRGGLPRGRPTLICGGAGCGKTLFAMEFLVRGARDFGEPGVFVSFEESAHDLAVNVASLGFPVAQLREEGRLLIDQIQVDRSEIEEAGEYNLDGLFVRLDYAIDSIGAKRVALDTVETIFHTFQNWAVLRSELLRLFQWLKEKGVTAVITAERGRESLSRQGLEEYISDCVIVLDHRVKDQLTTRRMRIVKYRGSGHETNEYPFLIGDDGLSVFPITSVELDHEVLSEQISTGVDRLDAMLGGGGYYRGSSVLVTGTAGTGKSSLAAHLVHAACRRGERCLYFAFEESAGQIIRNMRSIGIDLGPHREAGLLGFQASRPTAHGLEMHLLLMLKRIQEFEPSVLVVDPVTNLTSMGNAREVNLLLVRLIDFLRQRQITSLFTALNPGGEHPEQTDVGISSIMDTWILLREIETSGERNRGLYVLKSRGMKHSNQIREFLLTDQGIQLVDVYDGPGGVLTGSARALQEAQEKGAALARKREIERRRRLLQRKRLEMEARMASLQAELDAVQEDLQAGLDDLEAAEEMLDVGRVEAARLRQAD